jgi:riboflavin kinase
MRPDGPRDPVAGPDRGPEPPYPIRLSGPVIKGFGRGSKEVCVNPSISRFVSAPVWET